MEIRTSSGDFLIRTVEPTDNPFLKEIIVNSLLEFGATGDGFACNDAETQSMFESYQSTGRKYFTLVKKDPDQLLSPIVVGGAGVAPLKGSTEICEFVKMYYKPEVRGLGLGKIMLELCIREAKEMGYTQMYLETLERMSVARSLYEKYGFRQIEAPIGCTGHYSCDAFYLKHL